MTIDIIKIILAFPLILVLPGYLILAAMNALSLRKMDFFEVAAASVPLSPIICDLGVILMDYFNLTLDGYTIVGFVLIINFLAFALLQIAKKREKKQQPQNEKSDQTGKKLFDFSLSQTTFILVTLMLAVFIRVIFLTDTIIPASTDLGHHMYWVQDIIRSHHLPDYGMPDFILGEHIIFAMFSFLTGVGVMTAMPALVLLFINLSGIIMLAALAARVFKDRRVTALAFLFAGVPYSINAPQGKYVSGGVIGNVMGNLLIPAALYFFFRAVEEKDSRFAGIFLVLFGGLLYTHHLSALVLIFSVFAVTVLYFALNFRNIKQLLAQWFRIFLQPFPLAMIATFFVFFAFILTPSYFNLSAVDQATGSAVKSTRLGLPLSQIEMDIGSARFILAILGLLIISAKFKARKLKYSFALAWFLILFAMSWKPTWLMLDIPSNRVANYLFMPAVLLASYGMARFLDFFKKGSTRIVSALFLYVIFLYALTNGLADSAEAFKTRNQFQEAVEVYRSAEYLHDHIDVSRDVILKDHVNIYGDSWYKLFFMKDYKYPLSRGNLSRYEDPTKPREMCTMLMISNPMSDEGRACYHETGVNYVVLNSRLEGSMFDKLPNFSKVYSSNNISIFKPAPNEQ